MQHGDGANREANDPAGRLRRLAGRGALAIAAFACLATSRPRWHLEPALPAGAPTSTPVGGHEGLLITIAASDRPEVACDLPERGRTWLRPLTGEPTEGPQVLRYLCPPGGRLAPIRLDGHGSGGGCDEPEPPASAFVRITGLATVATWTATGEGSFAIEPWRHSEAYGAVSVVIDAPAPVQVAATLDPGTDATAFDAVTTPSGDGKHYDFVLPLRKGGIPPGSKLRIYATAFGACTPDCPAAPGAVTITAASQR